MTDDTVRAEVINRKLYDNADEISALLASVTLRWYYECWRMMFYRHLNLAKMMAKEMIDGNHEDSIKAYDIFEVEIMDMVNMMISGELSANAMRTLL